MGARGEGTIKAGDRETHLLYTNRALADAEAVMGKSVMGAINGGYEAMGITDLVTLLRAGMEAARRDTGEAGRVTMADAYDVMDAVGLAGVYTVVIRAVSDVISYVPNGADPNG